MRIYHRRGVEIHHGNFTEVAHGWTTPTAIISDGAYGVSSFPGDPKSSRELPAWYEPHINTWTSMSTPETTLWFWNTEIGWATVHPLLEDAGWIYRACNTWDKGIGHIAGNSNTQTLRKFPQVTEICVQYEREPIIKLPTSAVKMRDWLRQEWKRTGLPMREANDACGVRSAATRKYLTQDDLWYLPPMEMLDRMAEYANQRGDPEGKPYFQWRNASGTEKGENKAVPVMRAKFNCPIGVTNVWQVRQVRDRERLKEGQKATHANQKPLSIIKRLITASTDPGDTVWEPFGGLCTAALASLQTGRRCQSAEIDPECTERAAKRLDLYQFG